MPPYALKSLSNRKVQYSYHDYIEAWYKVFLYQNESFSHSWFINFDKNFKGVIPLWFHRWWQVHGPVNKIISEEIQEVIRYFSTVTKLSHQEAQLPITIHFFDQYKISWILKWQYILSQNSHSCIVRQFFVKWWDKFDFSRVQTRLHHEYPLKKEAPQMIQPIMAQSQQPPEPITKQAPKSESPTSSKGKRHAKKDSRRLSLPLLSNFMRKMK